MNSLSGLSSQQLRQAADIRERIDALQQELEALLSGGSVRSIAAGPRVRGKRNMSAAGRARISAAAKARWAAYRAAAPVSSSRKAKRNFSAASRARLAALARERWAKAKRSGKSRL